MNKTIYLIESWNKKKRRYQKIIDAGTRKDATPEDKAKMKAAVDDMEKRNKRAQRRINDTNKANERWGYVKKAIKPVSAVATALTFPALKKAKIKNGAVRGLATSAVGFGLKKASDKAHQIIDRKTKENTEHVKKVQRTISDKQELIKRTGMGSSQSYPSKKKQNPQQQPAQKKPQQQQKKQKKPNPWKRDPAECGLS